MAEQLQTVEWFADFVNTTVANAYYLISTGRVPGVVRLGPRMIRIDAEQVVAWVKAGGFEIGDRALQSRREQGLPDHVADPETIAQVATIVSTTGAER